MRESKRYSPQEPGIGDYDNLEKSRHNPEKDSLPQVNVSHDNTGTRLQSPDYMQQLPPRKSAWRWLWPLLVLVLIVALTLAWLNQDRLRALLPYTHVRTMLQQADKALENNYLDGSDGTSASELYQQVLTEDPDNKKAKDGLEKVGKAELDKAHDLLRQGSFSAAGERIDRAQALLGDSPRIAQARDVLQQAQASAGKIQQLVDYAHEQRLAGHLTGDNGAASLYSRALEMDPDNVLARQGLDKVGDQLVVNIKKAIGDDQLATASDLMALFTRLFPDDERIAVLKKELEQIRVTHEDQINKKADQAEQALKNGHLTGDEGALSQFRHVLQLDPHNARARTGLKQVAQALVDKADKAMSDIEVGKAKKLLNQAATLAPDMPSLIMARSRLQVIVETEGAQVLAQAQQHLTPRQKREVKRLTEKAARAAGNNQILLPPGNSAFDLYHKALRIDANNKQARQGLRDLSTRASKQFDHAITEDDLLTAQNYLVIQRSLKPGSKTVDRMNEKLADAWMNRAEKDIRKHDRAAATDALKIVHRLLPDNPRLGRLQSQLNEL